MSAGVEYLAGRRLVIATMHGKEQVIAPLLEAATGVQCMAGREIDTDRLGTFTGEVERRLDPLAAAREKCRLAMDLYDCDLAVASEGSFGPHASLALLPADDELVLLVDRKNGLEIWGREVSTATNYSHMNIGSGDDLLSFAQRVSFPIHGVILRGATPGREHIIKDIPDEAALLAAWERLRAIGGSIRAETDMRAMRNPTRMQVIAKATQKLITKAISTCPQCTTPGYSITSIIQGLPCCWCGSPTQSAAGYLYHCTKCGYEHTKPSEKTHEDPMYCDVCNP